LDYMKGSTCIFFQPFIPDWFIALVAPVSGMKFEIFFWSSFFGVIPNAIIFLKLGGILRKIDEIKVGCSILNTLVRV